MLSFWSLNWRGCGSKGSLMSSKRRDAGWHCADLTSFAC
uniref:Uncharacterized protein n=1 Tax=Rhizophora mucronata TaxID=61149 RepID=A0A2P2KNA6_RHIMU